MGVMDKDVSKYYRIKVFSAMTSVSVRTLQYYDDIDLLKPAKRSEAGYRLYSEEDLLRLQQIVTLKYLGLPLTTIKEILLNADFDVLASLKFQAHTFAQEAQRVRQVSSLLEYLATQMQDNQAINWASMTNIIKVLEMNRMGDQMTSKYQQQMSNCELGKQSDYQETYNPDTLFPIPRAGKRQEIGVDQENPIFQGFDCWNHYEVSWLNNKGKPMVAIAEIFYDCHTPNIVESKSLKLYFNSLNNTRFDFLAKLQQTVTQDLQERVEGEVIVNFYPVNSDKFTNIQRNLTGTCLDDLDISCEEYLVNPNLLTTHDNQVTETLHSHLLRSNCLITNQPDWGSVQIDYQGKQIDHAGLLRYLVSFRNHNEFHEQCIERIFMDIMGHCQSEKLTVYGRYTRRGGLDINPYRSTHPVDMQNIRLPRQ